MKHKQRWIAAAATAVAIAVTAALCWIILTGPFSADPDFSAVPSSGASAAEKTTEPTAETTASETAIAPTITVPSVDTTKPTTANPNPPDPGSYIQPAGAPWNLLLVNAWNPMDKAYYQDTYKNHIVKYKTGGQIDDRVAVALEKMLEAAKETGLKAGYLFRTPEKSASNLENKTQYYMKKGYSRDEARKKALETIAAPYTSEHNLGLAIDMIQNGDWSLKVSFEETKAFAWLQEHGAEYGFILRYPKGKEAITGVSYEPWHYRYVGKEHAQEIMRRGLTLEEYLQEKGL